MIVTLIAAGSFVLVGASNLPRPPASSPPRQINLTGYVCPTCPSTPDPGRLLSLLPQSYTTVLFAFAGWDNSGSILNQWDAPDRGFYLNSSVVASLQSRGFAVGISVGGGAGNVLPSPLPQGFAATMQSGLSSLINALNITVVDFDLENWPGEVQSISAAAAAIRTVVAGLRAAHQGLLISGAPQMTDLYCDYPSITAGFNRYAELVGALDVVMPQMYNTWGAVETIAYAELYAAGLIEGCEIAPVNVNVSVTPRNLMLGYPASRNGASSGFIDPSAVVAMYRSLQEQGVVLNGLMTWDCGWDEQDGFAFAHAVAAANAVAPTEQ